MANRSPVMKTNEERIESLKKVLDQLKDQDKYGQIHHYAVVLSTDKQLVYGSSFGSEQEEICDLLLDGLYFLEKHGIAQIEGQIESVGV